MSYLAPTLDWLNTPLQAGVAHAVAPWAAWHGRLMVLAWVLLIPLGILLARYFKVMPGQAWPDELDNKTWWHGHRVLQGLAVLLMLLAWALLGQHARGASPAAHWHALSGQALLALGLLQVLGGWLRGSKGGPTDARGLRGDHYDMTPRRLVFEWLHKVLGYLALLLSCVVVGLGLWVANAPRWMPLLIAAWWLGWLMVFIGLQRRGWCVDTYQAIWGDAPNLPGLQRRPTGWGVRRYSRASYALRFAAPARRR